VKEVQFRTRYGAAVIAVQREGKRVHQLPGVIKLQAGDVLLLEAGPAFLGKNPQNDTSFSLLVEVKDSAPPRLRFLIPTLFIFVAAVAVYAAQVTSLFTSMLVAAIVLVFLGVISVQEARHSLNWDMYITVAAAFGISNGLVNSGVAGGYASFLVMIGNGVGLGDAGAIAGVYLTTVLVSNVLTNAAAAALLFPMALNAANQVGTPPTIMAFTVMLGASASFIYPYGYSTNLLIFGPGKYKYMDFILFGAPLQLILWVSATAVLSVDSWRVPWIVSWSLFLSAVAVRVAFSVLRLPT
jgi:di/tricarboxylate transporter